MNVDELAPSMRSFHDARTEAEVFSALHRICASLLGSVDLIGFSMTRSGRALRNVITIGTPECPDKAAETFGDWLVAGEALPDGLAADGKVMAERLVCGERLVGGFVMTGHWIDEERARDTLALILPICALSLSACQQQRLSEVVLEALEESEEAISLYDADEGIIFSNAAYHRVFPHLPEPADLLGHTHLALYRMDLEAGIIDDPLAKSDPDAYLAERRRLSEALVTRQREIQTLSGKTYIYTRSRSRTGATMSRRIDITDQALTEARLRDRERELQIMAFHDPLTGLANRAYFLDLIVRLQTLLKKGELGQVAALVIDLNEFKFINDTHGHDAGDAVLREVAARIAGLVPGGDAVVRLGGDEFVIVSGRAQTVEDLGALAERILLALSRPIQHQDLVLTTGASIGIALHAGTDGDLDDLITDADLAMYEVKKRKCSAYLFFDPVMRSSMLERLALLESLRGALDRREFELHYQPQFDTQTSTLVGFEALVRWRHPERGLVSPGVFIPMMEEHGLINALGEWVLRTACAEAVQWHGALHIAVNVSPLQVRSEAFSAILQDVLAQTGIEPGRLELEITESVFISDEVGTRAQLEFWKSLGVRIALDDFGSGYSSLSYLSAFPIDKIKIDRGFLAKLNPRDPDRAADIILRTIIDLGRALNMTVTAEGVERADQLDFLNERHCAEVQGFLLGRPVPAHEARSWLATAAAPETVADALTV